MTGQLSLQEQFLLLCLNDQTGKSEEQWVGYGVNGGALVELMLQERISLDEKNHVVVRDASPTGDEVLDRALTRLAESNGSRPMMAWIRDVDGGNPNGVQMLLDRLVLRGILRKEEGRVLWVLPISRHPAADPAPEQALRDDLRAAITGSAAVDQRLAALIGLLQGSHALDRILTKDEQEGHRDRIEQICSGDAVSRTGSKAVSDAVTAAIAAMTATTLFTSGAVTAIMSSSHSSSH